MLAHLTDNVRGMVYRSRIDDARTLVYLSDRCRDITGYDAHRLIGNRNIAFGDLIHPDDRSYVQEMIHAALVAHRRFTINYRIRAAHGSFLQIEDRGTGVYDHNGEPVAIDGIVDTLTPPVESHFGN
jgi:PAS domain S-box-containing protein